MSFNDLNDLFNYKIRAGRNDEEIITTNRRKIIKELEPIYNMDKHKISNDLVARCFYNIDQMWFNGTIQKKIDELGYRIRFLVNSRLTTVAGRFGRINESNLEIQMSKPILDNLFTAKVKRVAIGGIICNSLLEVFIVLMEHEITHLIIFLLSDNPYIKSVKQQHHSKAFKVFIYNMFQQTRVTHNLLFGDIDIFQKATEKAKGEFNIGDIVRCTTNKNIEGKLVTTTSKHGVIKISTGKYKGCLLKDLELIKPTEQQNIIELLKASINIGENKELELAGEKVQGVILDKSNATFKIKLTNTGKIYSVKYWSLI